MTNFINIINNICKKNNIKVTLLSRDWIIMLEKENKTRFIAGYKFGINDHATGEIFDDKYALYELFKIKNIPIIDHNILYSENNKNEYAKGFNNIENVKEFLKKYKTIVIKSNVGTCGNEVYKINDEIELEKIVNRLLSKHISISYCPYYNIKNEYRLIVLNNRIKLVYKKIRPVVIGNGINTIKELLINFNEPYFKNKLQDDFYNRVLDANEIYEYSWKFNLSNGAIGTFDIEEDKKNKLKNIVETITKTIDIKFASVDIVEIDNDFLVLEINSGVMMENLYNIISDKKVIENIYEEAILNMFKI